MLNNEAQAASATIVVNPVSAANTAAATSGWIDVRSIEGDLLFVQQVGAVTGSLAGKIRDADDSSGTGAADVTGATFTSVSTANNVQKLAVRSDTVRGWVQYVGTVTTGPALVSVSLLGRPKIV